MKKIIGISLFFIFFSSCENKFPNYIKKADGVYMELLSFDDDEKKFKNTYYTSATITISANNKVIYRRYNEDIISPSENNLNFLFNYLTQGDSAQFKISSEIIRKEFSTIPLTKINIKYVDIHIKIHQFYTLKEFEIQKSKRDAEMTEQILLSKYLKENKKDGYLLKNGIYIKKIKNDIGERIKKGTVISINYKGSFVNGLEFDNNYKETALTFTYGTPDQVIKGLEIAINGMKKGEKSKIIIPSQLAFGEEGSSTQIVPPFTTVIYELEILNVK